MFTNKLSTVNNVRVNPGVVSKSSTAAPQTVWDMLLLQKSGMLQMQIQVNRGASWTYINSPQLIMSDTSNKYNKNYNNKNWKFLNHFKSRPPNKFDYPYREIWNNMLIMFNICLHEKICLHGKKDWDWHIVFIWSREFSYYKRRTSVHI